MSRSVFWALVRKDLFLMRGFIIAMLVVGLGSWALMGQGGKAFAVGGLLFLTANVAGAMLGVRIGKGIRRLCRPHHDGGQQGNQCDGGSGGNMHPIERAHDVLLDQM